MIDSCIQTGGHSPSTLKSGGGSSPPCPPPISLPLQRFVIANSVLKNQKQLIEEEQVEVCAEKLPVAALDENVVCTSHYRKYFSHDAWLLVNMQCRSTEEDKFYICMQILFP